MDRAAEPHQETCMAAKERLTTTEIAVLLLMGADHSWEREIRIVASHIEIALE